jgi:exodeoxyribonuclease V alpha subunit
VPLAEKLLEVPQQLIRTALELELKDGTVIADRVGETPCVSLAGLYRAERTIAESIPKISKVANAERFEAWWAPRWSATRYAKQEDRLAERRHLCGRSWFQ